MTLHRIETMGRSLNLNEGVKARVADPFWMLGRQWQVGEFRGDDASQPVSVTLQAEIVPITSFKTGTTKAIPACWAGGKAPPLEALAEATTATRSSGFSGVYLSARIGKELHQAWLADGLEQLASTLASEFRFTGLPSGLVGNGRQIAAVRLLQRRGIDGTLALDDPRGVLDAAIQTIKSNRQREKAKRTLEAWHLAHKPYDHSAWRPARMEYEFSLSAATDDGEIVLQASEHPGGNLDWFQFDVGGEKHALEEIEPNISKPIVRPLPTPVSYSGMPASRWWEMEDRAVHMGDPQSGPGDFARLMVAEFATSYSDDWFMVPLRVPRGTLVRVVSLKVTDNFGTSFGKPPEQVDHVAVIDGRMVAKNELRTRTFRLFEMSNDPGPANGHAPWLFVAPVLGSTMQAPPIERVELARDESANLAWAIERIVEGPLGRAMDRGREWFASVASDPPVPTAGRGVTANYEDQAWRYRLSPDLPPPWWIPFLPERIDGTNEMRLRRGRMRNWVDLPDDTTGPVGSLLSMRSDPFFLEEEEVARSGVAVVRSRQFARGQDGSAHLWLENQKQAGRGERSSGLRWDILDWEV